MVNGVDIGPTRDALLELMTQLRDAVGRPVDVEDAATLVRQLHDIRALALDAADASLVIARIASITYKRLEEITGIADSTLHERVTRWLKNEGTR